MNERSDIDRVLRHWMADGPSTMPDRVVDVIADRISVQPQRRSWRLLRRLPMSPLVKFTAAAAAALVIAALGWNLLPGTGPGVRPSPTPPVSPTPSASRAPSSTREPTVMDVPGESISWTASIPSGWTGGGGWALTNGQGFGGPTGIGVAVTSAVNVPSDPCDAIGKPSEAAAPADVVAALEARQDLTVTNAIETTLGGFSGRRVDVQAPADLGACSGSYFLFAEPDGRGFYFQGPSNQLRIWILDVAGSPIAFWIESFAGTPASDLIAAQQIVDSIVITP